MVRPFKPLVAFALAAACFAVPVGGQVLSQRPPTAPGAVADGEQAGITTLHAYSNLVVIDVVVSDSKKNPIRHLQASDFTLIENGRPQQIRNFEEHSILPASETARVAPAPKLPPGLFTNKPPAPASGPVNVLLLDYLNTPLNAQPFARAQLMDYLSKAPAGTRIAIFGLTTSLSMLQGFTSDPEVLKAALASKKGAPQVSQILSDPINGGPTGNTTLSDNFNSSSVLNLPGGTPEMLADIERFEALQASFELDLRAKYTLSAFDLLARYLVGIPGRKNVIWFSGSFPLNVEPNVTEADPNDSVVRNDDELRKTDNLLTRAQIAVYPVDARGLLTNPSLSVTNSTPVGPTDQIDFMTQMAQEHETMYAMAEDTGGEAFLNTNGLSQAVAKAIEDGSNYYTLTYSPSDSAWDGTFRAIKVKVAEPGVKLSYRNGYYADDPDDRNRTIAGYAATALARPTTMNLAMMHGGPDPAEILFKVRIRPAAMPPEDAPIKSNQTNPDPKVKVQGPYKEYGVDLVPDAHAVNCPRAATGNRSCAIEVWTYVYDREGQRLVTASNRVRATLTAADYAKMLGTGMAFHQQISVPVRGEYFLRTAIHDLVSDRVGAVEIPVASVARLQPLDALAGAAAAPALGGTAKQTAADAAPATAAATSVPVATPDGPAATPK